MPDGNPECGWCHDGDLCRDRNGLECLMTESDGYSLRRNHTKRDTEGEITGAGAATLSSRRVAAVCQLGGGYGQQDTESRDAGIFQAFISPTYISLPAALFSRFYVYCPVHV